MGRDAGDIALYAGLAGGAESIIVPEMNFDIDKVVEKALKGKLRGKLHNIIILAEGVGDAHHLAKELKKKTDIDTRVTILGHIQRGGSPTAYDRIIASQMGRRAVELLIESHNGRVLGIKGNEIVDMDIDSALEMKRDFNEFMYDTAKMLSI